MKIIEFLTKLNNGEIPENTIFYDKYTRTEYIYEPRSYAGIYPNKEKVTADEDWLNSLGSGVFRLDDEIEIIEQPKKLEKITWNDKSKWNGKSINDTEMLMSRTEQLKKSLNEIIDKLGENDE